ncbi:hypothetical protein [Caballeronia sp. J97]|uniref:hypothetical protein n=1 Tax=Caballeronia sp. J97 TaxID=2805429 RepID=UPI002AB262CC|nr:hypothetical protein [Caballeronia sp. J97]
MKLAKVKVEYTCGLTLVDKVTLDVATGAVSLPPRLRALMAEMEKSEYPPAIVLDYRGRDLSVRLTDDGAFFIDLLPEPDEGVVQHLKHSLSFPTENQRQQNARYLHTLSAASLGGAVALWHSTRTWDAAAVVNLTCLVVFAVVLWIIGFRHMDGGN